ncbi:hypothetical protein [Nocardioides sp.]|uniref:hypothetical protein n=1 Tax=Nocardioides sp. TaxID=35761 RepID=UPI003D0B61BE
MSPQASEQLNADPVRRIVETLHDRINARFPERGLRRAALDLLRLVDEVASVSSESQGRVRTARLWSRVLMVVVLAATVVALGFTVRDVLREETLHSSLVWLPLLGTVISDLVYAAIAVFFLYSFPERIRRGRTLELLHQLRSMAHVIDMHQLAKDPEQLRSSFVPTSASTRNDLTRDEMERYLDYCSELLSLVGKAAALCAEASRDAVVLDTVSTIEALTTGMSRKIWQKISLLPD